jgi:uncharacterized glyoxalase superfamily protein PhnB
VVGRNVVMSVPTVQRDARSPLIPAAVNLVSIFCADHRALADWYGVTFGFSEITALTSPVFVALNAGAIALGFHHDDAYDLLGLAGERHPRGTKIHLTLDAGDAETIDGVCPTLIERGATVIRGPFTTYYGARQIVFADPEGNIMRISTAQSDLNLDGRRPTTSPPAEGHPR